MDRDPDESVRQPAPPTPLLEWIGAATGSLAALALIGSLAFEALTRADTPPQLSVAAIGEPAASPGAGSSRVIPFRVSNDGGRTAAEVIVVARTAPADGAAVETEIIFDFVPRGSQRDGAIVLPGAAGGTVSFRIAGYREP